MDDEHLEEALGSVNPDLRRFLKRLVIGTAFAVPVVSSFSMSGLSTNVAHAQASNVSG